MFVIGTSGIDALGVGRRHPRSDSLERLTEFILPSGPRLKLPRCATRQVRSLWRPCWLRPPAGLLRADMER